MNDNNHEVATQVVTILKEKLLIDVEDTILETTLKDGSIKEADWKLILQTGLFNNTQNTNDETA